MSHGTELPSDAVATNAAATVLASQDLRQGNVDDDDGRVIDSFFVERDNPPPTEPSTPAVLVTDPPRHRPDATRTMTGNQTMVNTFAPFQLLPRDERRKSVTLLVTGATTDVLIWADDVTKLMSPDGSITPPQAAIIPAGSGPYVIDGHNGPVCVGVLPGNAGAIRLSWHTVTS